MEGNLGTQDDVDMKDDNAHSFELGEEMRQANGFVPQNVNAPEEDGKFDGDDSDRLLNTTDANRLEMAIQQGLVGNEHVAPLNSSRPEEANHITRDPSRTTSLDRELNGNQHTFDGFLRPRDQQFQNFSTTDTNSNPPLGTYQQQQHPQPSDPLHPRATSVAPTYQRENHPNFQSEHIIRPGTAQHDLFSRRGRQLPTGNINGNYNAPRHQGAYDQTNDMQDVKMEASPPMMMLNQQNQAPQQLTPQQFQQYQRFLRAQRQAMITQAAINGQMGGSYAPNMQGAPQAQYQRSAGMPGQPSFHPHGPGGYNQYPTPGIAPMYGGFNTANGTMMQPSFRNLANTSAQYDLFAGAQQPPDRTTQGDSEDFTNSSAVGGCGGNQHSANCVNGGHNTGTAQYNPLDRPKVNAVSGAMLRAGLDTSDTRIPTTVANPSAPNNQDGNQLRPAPGTLSIGQQPGFIRTYKDAATHQRRAAQNENLDFLERCQIRLHSIAWRILQIEQLKPDAEQEQGKAEMMPLRHMLDTYRNRAKFYQERGQPMPMTRANHQSLAEMHYKAALALENRLNRAQNGNAAQVAQAANVTLPANASSANGANQVSNESEPKPKSTMEGITDEDAEGEEDDEQPAKEKPEVFPRLCDPMNPPRKSCTKHQLDMLAISESDRIIEKKTLMKSGLEAYRIASKRRQDMIALHAQPTAGQNLHPDTARPAHDNVIPATYPVVPNYRNPSGPPYFPNPPAHGPTARQQQLQQLQHRLLQQQQQAAYQAHLLAQQRQQAAAHLQQSQPPPQGYTTIQQTYAPGKRAPSPPPLPASARSKRSRTTATAPTSFAHDPAAPTTASPPPDPWTPERLRARPIKEESVSPAKAADNPDAKDVSPASSGLSDPPPSEVLDGTPSRKVVLDAELEDSEDEFVDEGEEGEGEDEGSEFGAGKGKGKKGGKKAGGMKGRRSLLGKKGKTAGLRG